MSPLITVYVVNHNYGRFLSKAMDSLLSQTYDNIEILLIDDGSTDGSSQLVEGYDKYENVFPVLQSNKGLVVTNNIALRLARGEYIMRLDADDFLDPNAISVLAAKLDRNPDVGLVFPDYYEVDADGEVTNLIRRHDFEKVELLDQPAHGACTLIRRKLLTEIGGYDEQFKCHDGVDLWFKLLGKYKVKNINLPLFFYRQHGKSLTKNIEKIFKTRDKIFNKHTKNKKKFKNILGIIPVRGGNYGETLVALKKINNTIIIHKLIKELQKTLNIKKILVSSPDDTVLKAVSKKFKNKIIIHKREAKLARLNTPIDETLKNAIKRIKTKKFIPDLVLVVNVVCPLLNHKNFDAAINLIKIFETDEVIAVKKENDNFYFHNGKSLKPFNKNNNLSLERNEVYREIGGLRLIKPTKIGKKNNTIGHIFLDEKSSFKIRDKQDLKIAEVLSKKTIG